MKIAFVGKGGSGKSTLSALFSRYLAAQKLPVLTIDADINQHLGIALGISDTKLRSLPQMGKEILKIKKHLKGSNSRILKPESMHRTTPPGNGSQLLRVNEENPIFGYFGYKIDGVHFLSLGEFTDDDLGVKCYHGKIGAAELVLNHIYDTKNDYVITDMTAGADPFSTGIFTKFDITYIVVEPTQKSVDVFNQYIDYAKRFSDIPLDIRAIGNKVLDEEDKVFLEKNIGTKLETIFSHSIYVRSLEKGVFKPIENLEPENIQVLQKIKSELDKKEKDWQQFYNNIVKIHKKTLAYWENAAELEAQIDPTFTGDDYKKLAEQS